MTPPDAQIMAARHEADMARARLFGTIAEVQDRLKPSNLAQGAIDSATQGVASVARKGADAARKRPLAVAGALGAVGLVLARGWIADTLFGRDETSKAKKG